MCVFCKIIINVNINGVAADIWYQWCCGWKRKPTGALASSSRLVLQPTLAENDLTAYISSFPTPEGSTTFSLKQVTQAPDNASRALAFLACRPSHAQTVPGKTPLAVIGFPLQWFGYLSILTALIICSSHAHDGVAGSTARIFPKCHILAKDCQYSVINDVWKGNILWSFILHHAPGGF